MPMFNSQGDQGAAALERARQGRINRGMADINQAFSGFNNDFYNKAGTAYTKAETPGMMSDYLRTRNNLNYQLASGGNLESSAGTQRNASLDKELASNEARIASGAADQENAVRSNVNTQKGALVQQLEASADPTATSAQATAVTSQLRAPSPIQPLGDLFADWSNQYLMRSAFQPNPAGGGGNVWAGLMNMGYGSPVGAAGGGGSSYQVP